MAKNIKYFFLILLVPLLLYPQNYPVKFDHISRKEGLPHSKVNCIFKDSEGFIWVGTQCGLCRYDGYSFKTFQPDPYNPQSLSHSYVMTIHETLSDSGNILWVGTGGGGLCKFDKKREIFSTYIFDKNNPGSIGSSFISTIVPDGNGKFWIGTGNGLEHFDPNTNTFKHFRYNSNAGNTLSENNITVLLKDQRGYLWIGTEVGGLYCFDPESNSIAHFKNDPLNPNSLSNDYVYSLCLDSKANLWIGTKNGLNCLDLENIPPNIFSTDLSNLKFNQYMPQPGDDRSLSGPWVLSILEDQSGQLWVATYGEGLNLFDKGAGEFFHYKTDPSNPYSLGNNELKCLYEDREQNILWIGTAGNGIYKYVIHKNRFAHYYHNPRDTNSLSKSTILPILEDKSGKIWIGTISKGVERFDPISGRFTHYTHDNKNPYSLPNSQVQSIYEDQHHNIWIGSSHGLSKYDPFNDQFINLIRSDQEVYMLCVHDICEEFLPGGNELWVGSFGGGLIKFNYQKNKFISYTSDPDNDETLSSNLILTLYLDPDSSRRIIWIGTEVGLNKFEIETERFTRYLHEQENPFSISNSQVFPVYRDRSGVLWVGTHGGGLNRFDEKEEKFYHYTKKDGLPDNHVIGILEDGQGNLWLSTFKGLSRFDPTNETFINFDSRDGLQSDRFSVWSYHQAKNGLMYFGGINGFNVFHPDSIRLNPYVPSVKITDFRLFHQSVIPGPKSTLKKSILNTEQITLSHDQDNISFDFAALSYAISTKNRYAYKMEGMDPDWVHTNASNRTANYTNLAPGEYIFRVKGSNNDGIWNEEGTSLTVIILPPWWQTSWAYGIYIFLFALTLYALRTYDIKRHRLKHDLELEHMHAEKLEEVNRAKSRFFANISHEFRTPLTLIEGPVKQLINGDLKGNLKETYHTILRNAQRVLNLVTQLLDLSKLESGKMQIQAKNINILPLLKGLVQSFASLANRKNITLNIKAPKTAIEFYIDEEKFEKIINNLLSNAFKFTPERGEIRVKVKKHPPKSPLDRGDESISPLEKGDKGGCKIPNSPDKKYRPPADLSGLNLPGFSKFPIPNSDFIEIIISNTGPGIPPDQLDKIFDRFYQVDDSNTRHHDGTGIGLALTKELVELHHGTITVSTDIARHVPTDSLTIFTIHLPTDRDHLTDDEIVGDETIGDTRQDVYLHETDRPASYEAHTDVTVLTSNSKTIANQHKPIILIVEDHAEVRGYIEGILRDEYRIIQAEDGGKGLKLATEKQPDLILSDVMMPQMDGFEFCRRIKEDHQTSHIPVILLTARAGQKDRLEGLETGADDYLTKPFDAKELQMRVQNLIQQRRNLKERFSQDPNSPVEMLAPTTLDRNFLHKALEILKTHLENSQFDAMVFSREIGMSRSQLYRKLHALTGHSVSSFIRLYRLKQAARFLRKHEYNVSQICYDVGFSNPSYFSECFRKQFGLPPSQYARQANRPSVLKE